MFLFGDRIRSPEEFKVNNIAKAFVAFFAFTLFVVAVSAQEVPKIINGGILNGKAKSLPKPEYPEWAKAAKLEGTVYVDVVIDEEGNVASAAASNERRKRSTGKDAENAIEVEPADATLRDLAEKAALEAKFAPTRLNGTPTKIKGTIVYNFSLSAAPETETASIPKSEDTWKGRTISGGVLNGKAVNLPLPPYPAAAAAVKASGAVSVQVMIDENGNVISAQAVSGHPLLRAAAVDAARAAAFSPTMLSGEPVRVTGVITYVFTP
jgi:TonB family protein